MIEIGPGKEKEVLTPVPPFSGTPLICQTPETENSIATTPTTRLPKKVNRLWSGM